MSATITPLVVGNWKMNGRGASLAEVQKLGVLMSTGEAPRCLVVVCPPATLLTAVSSTGATCGIIGGAQDCHQGSDGAHTGDISAGMIADSGGRYVIVGHSERRADHGESDDLVRLKALAAIAAGLVPIVCVGETREQREAGRAEQVVGAQLAASVPDEAAEHPIVIAYEPVWAIGTGLTPTSEDIAVMHAEIRRLLVTRFGEVGESVHILYGGSMKPSNARDILRVDNVDGGLVGGASLLADDFYAIISAV